MSILILISMIYVYVSFMLFNKTNKEENLVKWGIICLALLLCYNTFLSWMLTIIHIPINIFTIFICNSLVGSALLYSIKLKGKQKYYINIIDIIGLFVVTVFVFILCYKNFGSSLNIAYETTDPNIHFYTSKCFALGDSLLSHSTEKIPYYGGFKTIMPLFYVNAGMMMKSLTSFIGEQEFYKIFILADCFSLWLTATIFYASVISLCKNNIVKIILVGATCLYASGYPLNSMIFGFCYLSITVAIINLFIILLNEFKSLFFDGNIISRVTICVSIFMCAFSVYFGYYLFVPYVYSSAFIYLCYLFYKNKQLFSKISLVTLVILFIIPFIMGCTYFILPGLLSTGTTEASAIGAEGYVYRDLYSNIVIFLPFVLYYFVDSIKRKKFDALFIILMGLFTVALFILGYKGIASSYYYFKNYNVVWLICYYAFIKTIIKFSENNNLKIFVYSMCSVYIAVFSLWYFGFDEKITNNNLLFNPHPTLVNYFDIYSFNKTYINHTFRVSNEQMDLINETNNISKKQKLDNIPVAGDTNQRLWFLALTDIKPNIDTSQFNSFYESPITLDGYTNSDYKYLLVLDESEDNSRKKVDTTKFNMIIENSSGYILERK